MSIVEHAGFNEHAEANGEDVHRIFSVILGLFFVELIARHLFD
jgi:hypothetical protein